MVAKRKGKRGKNGACQAVKPNPYEFSSVKKLLCDASLTELMEQMRFGALSRLLHALKPYAPLPHVELLGTLFLANKRCS